MKKENLHKQKNLLIIGVLLIGILLSLNLISSAYELSNPKYTRSQEGTGFYGITNELDEGFCEKGQDFLIQISPFGCTPSLVRTDLLEEQNVPVFCPLSAIKINPLIDVNAIDRITFRGENSEYIQDIGFHHAKAALGREGDLNSPVLNNIGYVVITLNEQENASNVPDYVSGNLTATVKYDIENAFGIGKAEFYLPELNDKDFSDKRNNYGFWNGRGFIRAENIDDDSAVLSIYDGEKKLNRFKLDIGETSGNLYLPGFDCLAGLRVRLDSLENPDTRARLNINGQMIEAGVGEEFLEGRCVLKDIDKKGLVQEIKIRCKEDDNGFVSSRNTELQISPRVTLEVKGEEKDFIIGDKITELGNGDKSVYIGYIGEDEKGKYIIPVISDIDTEEEFKKTTFYKMSIPMGVKAAESNTGNFYNNFLKNTIVSFGRSITSGLQYSVGGDFALDKLRLNKDMSETDYISDTLNSIKKKVADLPEEGIIFKGIASPIDSELNQNTNEYYERAKQDYDVVLSDFSNLKYPEENNENHGERALKKLIDISYKLNQKSTMLRYCNEYQENYPKSYNENSKELCENIINLANSKISNQNFLINGDVKNIDFLGIYEPGIQDYNAKIRVTSPSGEKDIITLGKNSRLNMIYLTEDEEEVFVIDNVISTSKISSGIVDKVYFKYNNGKWYWTYSGERWVSVNNKKIVRDGLDYSFPSSMWDLRENFIGKDFKNGVDLILENNGYKKYSNDYIQLKSLDEESAVLEVNLESQRGAGSAVSTAGKYRIIGNKKLKNNEVVSFGSEYAFELIDVTLKKQAKVQIIPKIDNQETEANFSFKIGIEKRAIDLSTDEIKKRIDSLNNTISEWDEKSKELGKVVKSLKGACLVAGVGLTAKNFLANLGGEGIARKEQMKYWNDRCANEISDPDSDFYEEYSSKKIDKYTQPRIENCYDYYSDDIEESVKIRLETMKEQDKSFEECENNPDIYTKNWLGTKTINTDKLKDCYIDDSYKSNIQDCVNELSNNDELKSFSNDYIDSDLSLSELKELELNCNLLKTSMSPEDKELIQKDIKSKIESIYNLRKAEKEKDKAIEKAENDGLRNIDYAIHKDKDTKTIYYSRGTAEEENNYEGINGDTPVYMYEYNQKRYLLELEKNQYGETYSIVNVYDADSYNVLNKDDEEHKKIINEIKNNVVIEKIDESNYENEYKNPEVSFYETEPYRGLPSIVPFDLDNGWYVYVKQKIPVGKTMSSYDESGRVTSFYVCNVGENNREEKTSGDDVCELINTGTGQSYNNFPGLSKEDSRKYIDCASSAVEQASRQRQDNPKLDSVKISTNCDRNAVSKTGKPAANIPEMQCENFMSSDDCKILYNLCDPVICPSSRCDLGGTYPVKDVIQSGIIGSVFLCLPNFVGFGGDVYIPVCLTGIKSGIDGFVSVLTAYRDCLQESLDTGKQIGICDEIHSVYLCDFFWKQGKPLANLIIPKTLEVILNQNTQGGGEYLGVQDAWDTASGSMNYFTNYYAENSFNAFRTRAIDKVEQEVCKNFMSTSFPTSADLLDSFTEPDSPAQFHGRFDENEYTTSTNPPTSHYKVYYHIYSGKDTGAYYKVYLKGDSEGTYYEDAGASRVVATGYVKEGDYASETKDFTAPSGYKELCIVVNNQEECGFGETSTSYAVNRVKDKYVQEQVNKSDIKTEEECISGSSSLYSLFNLNAQSMAESAIDPAIYEKGITRICASDNPGKGTDNNIGGESQRWVDVGYCGQENIRCWIDTQNVEDLIRDTGIENETLKDIEDRIPDTTDGEDKINTPEDYDDEKDKILDLNVPGDISELEKIDLKTKLLDRLFYNSYKGDLLLERAKEFGDIAFKSYNDNSRKCQESCEDNNYEFGKHMKKSECDEKNGVVDSISIKDIEVSKGFVSYCEKEINKVLQELENSDSDYIEDNKYNNELKKLYQKGILSEEVYDKLIFSINNIGSAYNPDEDKPLLIKELKSVRNDCDEPGNEQLIRYSSEDGSGIDLSGTGIKSQCEDAVNNIQNIEYLGKYSSESGKGYINEDEAKLINKAFLTDESNYCDNCGRWFDGVDCSEKICNALGNIHTLESLSLKLDNKKSCGYNDGSCTQIRSSDIDYKFTDNQKEVEKQLNKLKAINVLDKEDYKLAMQYLISFDLNNLKNEVQDECNNLKDDSASTDYKDDELVCCCYNDEEEDEDEDGDESGDESGDDDNGDDKSVSGNLIDRCSEYAPFIKEYAGKYNIDAKLLMALMIQESGCQNGLEGDDGKSFGLMQIQESSFNEQCSDEIDSFEDLKSNAEENIQCGAIILKSKYNLFRNDCNAYSDCRIPECEVWTSAQCEWRCNDDGCEYRFVCDGVDKYYSGWNAALRAYNGWACSGNTVNDYVEEVNSWLNNAEGALNGGDGNGEVIDNGDMEIKNVELTQNDNNIIMIIKHECDSVEYTIRKVTPFFDSWKNPLGSDYEFFSPRYSSYSGDNGFLEKKYLLNEDEEGFFEVGEEYYIQLTCFNGDEKEEYNGKKEDNLLLIEELNEGENGNNECEIAFNEVINNLKDERGDIFNKDDYRASIYGLKEFGVKTQTLNGILNSNVDDAIQLLQDEKNSNC